MRNHGFYPSNDSRTLLVTKGIATRSKDAPRGTPGPTTRNMFFSLKKSKQAPQCSALAAPSEVAWLPPRSRTKQSVLVQRCSVCFARLWPEAPPASLSKEATSSSLIERLHETTYFIG